MKTNIENHGTIEPYVVGVELLQFTNEDDTEMFASQILLMMDEKATTFYYLPTDIIADTAEEAAMRTLSGLGMLFSSVMGTIYIFDMDSEDGDILGELDTAELMDKLQSKIGVSAEDTAIPLGTTIH